MKSLQRFAAVAIFAALTCAGLRAQPVDLRATIPFEFMVGHTLMPGGDYQVRTQGNGLVVRLIDSSRSVSVMTISGGVESKGQPRLEFHRYGFEYFLTAIRDPYSEVVREVPQTQREVGLARLSSPIQATIIAHKSDSFSPR